MLQKNAIVQEDGVIRVPAEFLERYGLQAGDEISLIETDAGLLVARREELVMKLLDSLGEELQSVSLEQLLEDSRGVRETIYREKYARPRNE